MTRLTRAWTRGVDEDVDEVYEGVDEVDEGVDES